MDKNGFNIAAIKSFIKINEELLRYNTVEDISEYISVAFDEVPGIISGTVCLKGIISNSKIPDNEFGHFSCNNNHFRNISSFYQFNDKDYLFFPVSVNENRLGCLILNIDRQYYRAEYDAYVNTIAMSIAFIFNDLNHEEDLSASLEKSIKLDCKSQTERQSPDIAYHSIFKSSGNAILIFDMGGRILEANQYASEMYGYSESELLSLHFYDIDIMKNVLDGPEGFSQTFLDKGPNTVESTHRRKDGSNFPVEMCFSHVNIDGPGRMFASVRDISVRKKKEQELQRTKLLLESVIEQAPMGIHILEKTKEGTKCFIQNEESKNLLGLKFQTDKYFPDIKAGEKNDYKVLDPVTHNEIPMEDLPRCRAFMGEYVQDAEYIIVRQDKTKIYIRSTASPVYLYGKIIAVFSAFYDISEVKYAEEKLRQREHYYRTFTQNLPAIVYRLHINRGNRIEFLNNMLETITGYSEKELFDDEIYNLDPLIITEDKDNLLQAVRKAVDDHSIINVKYRIVRKDTSICHIHEIGRPVFGKTGELIYIDGIMLDITRQSRIEKELIDKSIMLREIIMNSPIPMVLADKQSLKISIVNEACEEILNIQDEPSYIGRSLNNMKQTWQERDNNNQLVPTHELPLAKALRGISTNNYDVMIKRKDGSIRWALVHGVPIYNNEGILTGGFIAFPDITKRKLTEQALKLSMDRATALFEAMPDIVLLLDENKIIRENNLKSDSNIFDWPAEINNQRISYLLPRDASEWLNKKAEIVLNGGSSLFRSELGMDGTKINAEYRLAPLDSHTFLMLIRDITQQVETEQQLKNTKSDLTALFNTTNEIIMLLDTEGRIIRINDVWPKNLGIKAEDMIGENVFDFLSGNVKQVRYGRFLNSVLTGNIDSFVDSNNGRYFSNSVYPIKDDDGKVTGASLFVTDITDRKKSELELQKIAKLESIGTLAGGIAHNFKNILSAVSLNAGMARINPDARDQCLLNIQNSIDQATALANRFQTFTTAGQPLRETISIIDIIKDTESMALSGSSVVAQIAAPDDLWYVNVDPKQFNEVFMNLLLNAKQAMPHGGEINIEIRNLIITEDNPAALSQGKYIEIKVKDQGIGISQRNIEYIFDPFFTTKPEGHGLGLASVYFIVQNHKGHISVESKIDQGTQFTILLPASEAPYEQSDNEQTAIPGGEGQKILFMDDEDSIRDAAYYSLIMLGYNPEMAAHGAEAIEKYKEAMDKQEMFDIVVLDLTIKGGIGGEETLKELKQLNPDVKAIVCSGHSDKPIVANFSEYGFVARINKPVKIEDMAIVINDVLYPDLTID